jgi:hypothetical protein
LLSFGFYKTTRSNFWYRFFWVILILGTLTTLLTLAKAPVVHLFLGLLFLIYLLKKGLFLSKEILLVSIFIIFIPFLVVFFHGFNNVNPLTMARTTTMGLIERVFYDESDLFYYCFEIVPYQIDFLYGRTIEKLNWLTNRPPFDFSRFLYNYLFPFSPYEKGAAPPPFVGDLYVNFGIWGMSLGIVFIGWLTQMIQIWIFKRPKNITNTVLFAYLLTNFFFLVPASIWEILLSYGTIGAMIILPLMNLFSRDLDKRGSI